ncbi:MAG: hypothetical protein HYV76_02280 [Candidatus Vogelbacteria bacterium]|nr:hypothetical protein [Candidatus Vogelbacteria bacterium]
MKWLFLGLIGISFGLFDLVEAAPPAVISITPAKQEVIINPGETKWINLTVINSLTQSVDFRLAVEDLVVEQNSLIENVTVPTTTLTLNPDQTIAVPIKVSVPTGAYPGTRHGQIAIVIKGTEAVGNKATITTQLNSLLFIKIPGQVKESGRVTRFGLLNGLINIPTQNIGFYIAFTNDGNAYLNPYGLIKITNWRGQELGHAVIDPWYVLPNSTRIRDINDLILPTGLYQASLELNRGYGDLIDVKRIWFLVCPWWWRYILFGLSGLIVLIFGYRIIKV